MDNRRMISRQREIEVKVIINDFRSEIELEGLKLLTLEYDRPGVRVTCTNGTLWLTQQGDLNDHLLKAGQTFTLNQLGTVLVQGLPCGKALIQ